MTPALGPDATGVGWVFQYALVDTSGRHSNDELRSYQDWFLRYAVLGPSRDPVAADRHRAGQQHMAVAKQDVVGDAPAEVEDCLLQHPAVKECAVVGITEKSAAW